MNCKQCGFAIAENQRVRKLHGPHGTERQYRRELRNGGPCEVCNAAQAERELAAL